MARTGSPKPQKFQFFAIESYGLSAQGDRWTIEDVGKEGARHPEACSHVARPMVKRYLYAPHGPADSFAAHVERIRDEYEEETGRKVHPRARLAVMGFGSYPHSMEALRADPVLYADYRKWEALEMAFIHQEYGGRLYLAYPDFDEVHPHIHFYVEPHRVPENDFKLGVGRDHPGRHADDRKLSDRLAPYKAAMKALLDRHYEAVGRPMKWERKSDKTRKREASRQAYLLKKQRADEMARIDAFLASRGIQMTHAEILAQAPAEGQSAFPECSRNVPDMFPTDLSKSLSHR